MASNQTPLTHRRDPHRSDCWLIHFGDVHVGSIARAVGTPGAAERWAWFCGFYPGSNPGEQRGGTAATFDQAHADFEKAWMVVFGETHRGRLSVMARSARLDGTEICNVGAGRTAPVAPGQPMKYATSRPFADPDNGVAAGRKGYRGRRRGQADG
ncbi:hypothetical protein [Bradyrhizobium sp. URHD0069]|uniref:hypothetical protein n=1 Tax=Bradyrhizobium sp. URHD0069 TaxID=1380355 RepID=UPI000691C9C7|nr:hypothetical protein [Bradyrhizobium sp. URHD0069]